MKDKDVFACCANDLASYCALQFPNFDLAPHVQILCKSLEDIEAGRISRLMISIPPRHSKSLVSSTFFPAWYLGRHPERYVINATYGQDLSSDFGRKVRDQIADPLFQQIFPNCSLKEGSMSAQRFETTANGTYFAVGVGSAITGRGAHLCVTGDTEVVTTAGPMRIDYFCGLAERPKVLAFNHDSQKVEFASVTATATKEATEVIELTTSSGRQLSLTPEHPVFVNQSGYRAAGDIRAGDQISEIRPTVQRVREGQELQKRCWQAALPTMLFSSTAGRSSSALLLLFKRIYQEALRIRESLEEGARRFLLHAGLFQATPRCEESPPLRDLWCSGFEKNTPFLRGLQECAPQEISRQALHRLRNGFFSGFVKKAILWARVCESSAFGAHDWQKQFPLQGRAKLCQVVRSNASFDFRKGFESLRDLPQTKWDQKYQMERAAGSEVGSGNSPHGRKSRQQREHEFGDSVWTVPSELAQVQFETIVSTTRLYNQSVRVYDVTVEALNNFFANGVLVHNCLIDDPIKNAEEAASETMRSKLKQWYQSVLYTRLMPGASIVIVQTRWHQDDLSGWLLNPEEQEEIDPWVVINMPAIAERDEGWRKEGEALWPDKFPLDRLQVIRRQVGPQVWASLYQGRPAAAEGNIYKREWWKYYAWDPTLVLDPARRKEIPRFTRIIQSWDTAFKAKEKSDRSACTTWGDSPSGYFLLDSWAGRVEFPELKRQVNMLYDKWKPHQILIEDKASGQSLIQELRRPDPDRDNRKLPVKAIEVDKDKVSRANAVTGIIEAGWVYLPQSASWLADFQDELSCFPNGTHDDIADTVSQALQRLALMQSLDVEVRQQQKKPNMSGVFGV